MKKLIKILIVAVLVVNGATATYSGVNLMICPDGSSLNLSHHLLDLTPFESFFIPGLLLFLFNGVSSVSIFVAFYYDDKNTAAVKLQGMMILCFIIVQVILTGVLMPLHIVYGMFGLLIVICTYVFETTAPRRLSTHGALSNHI